MAAKLSSSGGLQSSGSVTDDFNYSGGSAFPSFDATPFVFGPVSSAAAVTAGGTAGVEVVSGGSTTPTIPFSTPGVQYLAGTNSGPSGSHTFSVEEILSGGSDSGVTVAGYNGLRVDAGGSVGNVTLSGGTLDIEQGGTAGSSTVTFTGAGGRLNLEDATAFHGTVSGFNQSASIDLENIKFSDASLSYSGGWQAGALTITDGNDSATLNMLGGDVAGGFNLPADTGQIYHLADDGHGGTLLTEQIPPDLPVAMSLGDGFWIVGIDWIWMPTLSSGQTMTVSSGQTASLTIPSLWGYVADINTNGSGSPTIVQPDLVTYTGFFVAGGAEVDVLAGGSAGGLVLMGGSLDNFGIATGIGIAGGTEIVESGGLSIGTYLLNGVQDVMSGGHALGASLDGLTWSDSSRYQYVFNGGQADSTTLGWAGEQVVYGVANATRLTNGLELIESGGVANGATISGGTLEIMSGGGTGSAAIAFAGGGQLKLDDATTFSGAISGFDNRESIDLTNIAFSGATLSYTDDGLSGTLTVGDGTHVATLDLLGQYDIRNFRIADDGHGGILLTDRAAQVMNGWDPVQRTGVITNDPTTIAWYTAHDPLMQWRVDSGEPLSWVGSLDDHGEFTTYLFGSSPYEIGSTVVSSGQTLVVSSGQTSSLIVENSGGEVVDSGTLTQGWLAGHTTVASGGVISDSRVYHGSLEVQSGGTASGILVESGTLQVDSGAVVDDDVLLQGGTVEIMSGVSILPAYYGGGGTFRGVAFQGSGGSLKIDDANGANPTIAGFDGSDSIDLANVAIGSATLGYAGDASSGTLTVTDGARTTWLTMIGNYVAANFHLADDGHGGTMITEAPVSSGAGLATPH